MAIYTPATCGYSDVNACINSDATGSCSPARHTAVNGDIIQIPAGTCTWTSNLVGPSGVGFTITGSGTPNSSTATIGASSSCTATQIIDNAGSVNPLMNFTPSFGASTMRVSCMAIDPFATNTTLYATIIMNGTCTAGGCPQARVDNITFGRNTHWTASGNGSQVTALTRYIGTFGVLDHNTLPVGSNVELFNAQLPTYKGVGLYGDNSWAQPNSLGGADNVFAENNLWNTNTGVGSALNDCEAPGPQGCRYVIRYNTMVQAATGSFGISENHGTETGGRYRSGRNAEVYNNTLTCQGACTTVDGSIRGGTAMFYNNTVNLTPGQGANSWATLSTYRVVASYVPWGACGGSGGYDQNDGTVYFSGTMSATNGSLTMTDSSKNFGSLTPSGAPYSVHDITQGFWSQVSSNTATTITVLGPISSSGWTGFNNNDSYEVLRATTCIDQPGRGTGVLLSGVTPSPTGWVTEALEPVYQWGDTKTGGANVNAPMGSNEGSQVISYRDFYVQASGIQTSSSAPFNCNGSTGGVGWGTLSNRPSSCSAGCTTNNPGCGYWATDTSTLYTWRSGAWSPYYAPYTYPHPLTSSSTTGGSTVVLSVQGFNATFF